MHQNTSYFYPPTLIFEVFGCFVILEPRVFTLYFKLSCVKGSLLMYAMSETLRGHLRGWPCFPLWEKHKIQCFYALLKCHTRVVDKMMNSIKQKYQCFYTYVPVIYVVTQHSCFLLSEEAVTCHSFFYNMKNYFHTVRTYIAGNMKQVSVLLLFDYNRLECFHVCARWRCCSLSIVNQTHTHTHNTTTLKTCCGLLMII